MTDPLLDSSLHILVADDDTGDRMQVRRALAKSGLSCECVEVDDVEHAIAACAAQDFDCAIVDYQMPGYDGIRGIVALHEQHPFMPIIMSTGQGDEMVATEAMKRGAMDYISKSQINPRSIRRTIESAVEKSALQREVARQRRELERFAHVLAHDLAAPIASMQLFARAVEEDLSNPATERGTVIADCDEIVDAGRRAKNLIDAVRAYTRADSEVPFGIVELSAVLRDALVNLAPLITARGAVVTSGDLPAVEGNAAQLSQLFENLIGNAVKYCDTPPPTIHIAALADRNRQRVITVSDNGIGIPAEERVHVFEPFKRLHGVGEYEGTGLGLATCKKVVERHRGRIWCEPNAKGTGTTFFFTLPEPQSVSQQSTQLNARTG